MQLSLATNKSRTGSHIILIEDVKPLKDTQENEIIFNKYCSSITKNLNLKGDPETFAEFRRTFKAIKEKFKIDNFSFRPFTGNEFTNVTPNLPTNKAGISNDIPIYILKQFVHVHCPKLTKIMNNCFLKKMFSGDIINAKMIPCCKNYNKGNKENYRSISILSNFSKIFQRLIHQEFSRYMEPKFCRFK